MVQVVAVWCSIVAGRKGVFRVEDDVCVVAMETWVVAAYCSVYCSVCCSVCCNVLYCVGVSCNLLQCVAVCCHVVAVYCSVVAGR